ncbi:MAG: hypothetical protein HY810_07715 [Candidatus Omnitrophica bacterium]|nr:hypothetical protein [Candidatus Omnitrophota bacterium]
MHSVLSARVLLNTPSFSDCFSAVFHENKNKASPPEELTLTEIEKIIQQAIAIHRISQLKSVSSRKPDFNPLSAQGRLNRCGTAQSDIKRLILHLSRGITDYIIRLRQIWMVSNLIDNTHAFIVISDLNNNTHYLIDPTFIQFFILPVTDPPIPRSIGYEGVIIRKNQRWSELSAQLLMYGYIKLADEITNMYLSALSNKTPEQMHTFNFKTADLINAPESIDDYSDEEFAKFFGPLEKRIYKENLQLKQSVDISVSAAIEQIKLGDSTNINNVIKKQIKTQQAIIENSI